MKKIILILSLALSNFIQAQTYGLYRITDMCAGSCNSVWDINSYSGKIYFSGIAPSGGVALWKSDGTVDGTVMVKETGQSFKTSYNNYFMEGPETSNGIFFFGAKTGDNNPFNLWRSDGTAAGTYALGSVMNPTNIIDINGVVVFVGATTANGNEIWRSDGTVAGTYMLKDIFPGTTSSLSYLKYTSVLNNKVFFQADDGVHGVELWVTDGTIAGTILVKDINIGTGISGDGIPNNFIAYHNAMYFTAEDYNLGSGIYKSDGTTSGTVRVLNNSWYDAPVIMNDTLYFAMANPAVPNGAGDEELYKSTGTQAHTYLVKDIFPGATNSSYPSFITSINGKLYFSADDGVHGREVWVSNGSASGTYMIQDIDPGSAGGFYTSSFRSANNKVYFTGHDPTHGLEMWETDGTTAGTKVYDIKPGTYSSNISSYRGYNNELYIKANDGVTGDELWKIGTAIPSTGVEELQYLSSISIYPNPFTSQTTISFTQDQKNTTVKILDVIGKEMKAINFTGKELVIEKGEMSAGIYFIQITNGNSVVNKKVVLQ